MFLPLFQRNFCLLLLLLMSILLSSTALANQKPVVSHGKLSVDDGQIVNQTGTPVSLAGPSFFWSNNGWHGEAFYNHKVVETFARDWKATVVRAALGVDGSGGFNLLPAENLKKIETVVDAAIDNGLYVIIDFHSHHAEEHQQQAINFFIKMAKKYGHYPNVIYEIYNEPLANVSWSKTVKPYAKKVISAIRSVDPDNLILVGSPTWSQDVDVVAKDPIVGEENIVYTLHFYAGTHKQSLRDKAQVALDAGLALFVSEWGAVNANGDGKIDYQSTKKWIAFMQKNNLSHCSWSVSNKNEMSAILKPNASVMGSWSDSDLTENGLLLKTIIQNW